MLRICKENKKSVLAQVRAGKLDSAMLSTTNLVDEIILSMHTNNILSSISKSIPDHRAHNTTIPYEVIWASAIAAKMKVRSSLTDIPYAISDHRTLAKLGYALVDIKQGLNQGLMQEGSLRFLIGKYTSDSLVNGYNKMVQEYTIPRFDFEPNIHILDCTDLEVNYFNHHYEGSGVSYSKRSPSGLLEKARGYKLATLRGLVKDSGIIEEIRLGPLNTNDLELSREMLLTTKLLKPGDILINDRGFISRNLINYLKIVKKVDTYVPLRQNMQAYDIAVQVSKEINRWSNHPIARFAKQKICLVTGLSPYWGDRSEPSDIPNADINACVVWDIDTDKYLVFATTDTSKSARDILKTYSLRPEIEEDYRQLKEFWKIEDFKSTKLNLITFHIVSVLFGYLFYLLYTMLPEGIQFQGKSLPVALKNYVVKVQGFIMLYEGGNFGILTLFEMMELYAKSKSAIRNKLKTILEQI